MQRIVKYSRRNSAGNHYCTPFVGYVRGKSSKHFWLLQSTGQVSGWLKFHHNVSLRDRYGSKKPKQHRSSPPQPHQRIKATQQDSEVSNASITVKGQVANHTRNGGVQWTIKSGTIVIKQNALTIANGQGEMDSMNRVVIDFTATDSNGHTVKWQLTGLAANYNGTLIALLNGNSSNEANHSVTRGNVFEDVTLTCIAAFS